jgi:CHAT domain-containing protein
VWFENIEVLRHDASRGFSYDDEPAGAARGAARADRFGNRVLPADPLRPAGQEGRQLMRTLSLVLAVWALGAGLSGRAAEAPPKKLTPEERKQLQGKWQEVNKTGFEQNEAGKVAEAATSWAEGLRIARRLYPREEYPDGHPDLAQSLNNMAAVLWAGGKSAEAETLLRDALAMRRRLSTGDHPELAVGLTNLASLLYAQGRYAEAEPPFQEALAMRRRLFQQDHALLAYSLNNLASVLGKQGHYADAETLFRDALAMRRRLFRGDQPELVVSLNGLAGVLLGQGKYAEAELVWRQALAMARRLLQGDHPDVAAILGNLATVLRTQGKYAEAELLFQESAEMYRRLSKGNHRDLAASIINLATVRADQGRYAEAETHYREALAIHRRLFQGDHPAEASNLVALATVIEGLGRHMEAETHCRDALAMRRRLSKADHPELAHNLDVLAVILHNQGKYAEAEPLFREALAMRRRLFRTDHFDLARSLNNLAHALLAQERYSEAEPLWRETLRMVRALTETYARDRAEGEVLTFLATLGGSQHSYLSCAKALQASPEAVYPEVWASKGAIARVYERRSLAARAAASDPKAAALLARLTDVRRRRADLILAPQPQDPASRRKRGEDLKDLADRITAFDRDLRPLLPALQRSDRLARATPGDLRKALPREAVFVDLLSYTLNEWDPKIPGEKGHKKTLCYLAFVVSHDAIRWVDLGPAGPIHEAVGLSREAITTPPHAVAADLPDRVRELVWAPLRGQFPDGTRVVYLSPDLNLSRVPWCALPGDRPGRLVLEEFAVAVIPHGPFLLDQLWPQDSAPKQQQQLLVAGGVAYGEAPRSADAAPALVAGTRSAPALKPGQPVTWGRLPGAEDEARAIAARAAGQKLDARLLLGTDASADRVLAELPKARFAHFATHGFFADPQFRSVLQLDPKQFEMGLRGEWIGAGALSPLVLSGLVFAGANRPETPGRGLVTGEALIDRDLSGLELAVLSACDTGLGEVAGGEGVFSLQRAFHLAGCKNVVASQWKVNDAATAALMGEFYRALWEENKPPILALQKAQLAVYRADPKQFRELALRGFAAGDKDLDAAKVVGAAPVRPGGRNPAVLWAAFTLSGAGR